MVASNKPSSAVAAAAAGSSSGARSAIATSASPVLATPESPSSFRCYHDAPDIPFSPVHDVYADNRSENLFGWVQPDEWETVAGPNKDLFLRGQCADCQAPPPPTSSTALHHDWSVASSPVRPFRTVRSDRSEWSQADFGARVGDPDPDTDVDPLGSCGGPSCGYGAACCDYSRGATWGVFSLPQHGRGNVESTATAAAAAAAATARPIFRDDSGNLGTVKDKGNDAGLGVTLTDIIHGRSCRPISLLDLRTFLLAQRVPHRRLPAYAPASDMAQSSLPDLDVLGALATSTATTASGRALPTLPKTGGRSRHAYDEVDALDFLVAFERYRIKYRDLAKAERMRSPDSLTCRAAIDAHNCRRSKHLATVEAQSGVGAVVAADDPTEAPSCASDLEALRSVRPQEIGLDPASQPLRHSLDRIVARYLSQCSGGSSEDGGDARQHRSWRTLRRSCKYSSDSVGSTVIGGDDKAKGRPQSGSGGGGGGKRSRDSGRRGSTCTSPPRLQWMIDVGLFSQDAIALAVAESAFTSHPDTLTPLADAINAYLFAHVLPFFISVAKNLSDATSRGRLAVGIACTIVAIVFTVLLLLRPSPLLAHLHRGGSGGESDGEINRWWRLLLTPIWAAALGYILAYRTGVCVWLTLRGNRESDEDEEREREEIRSRFSDDAAGFSFAEVEADAELRDDDVERRTNRCMAPELASLLLTGRMPKRGANGNEASNTSSSRIQSSSVGQSRAHSFQIGRAPAVSVSAVTVDMTAVDPVNDGAAAATRVLYSRSRSVDFGARARNANVSGPAPPSPVNERGNTLKSILNGRPSHTQNQLGEDEMAGASTLVRGRRLPLFPLTVGVVKSPTRSAANALEESLQARHHVDHQVLHSPVVTRDALLFDPELARAVHKAAASRRPSLAVLNGMPATPGTTGRVPNDASTPLAAPFNFRRPSVAVEPTLGGSGGNGQRAKTQASARPNSSTVSYLSDGEAEKEKKEPFTFDIEALAVTDPASKRSATTTATVALRWVRDKVRASWTSIRRWTGFAVGTKKVLDARVRRAQQIKALKAMAYDFGATAVIMAVILAVP